ncbi:MAG: ABC transporter ATP-binding protein [Synergistaceae bacterium]|jgi:branched-chain amino acid transport system ATP-binding protein|nr:ABC transporter ATP-binding protein [Synergistaceae bacterium]
MLQIRNLHAYYGAIEALTGIDADIPDGSICCIIGSNGAGKTTLLKSISGMIKRTGSIKWNDTNLINAKPREVAKLGITHVPEGRHIFPGLTVYQNLESGTISWHGFFGNKPFQNDIETVYELFPRLREREKQLGWSLSGGEQQMLAVGRGIMARPKLLMLDEPSMGLAPVIVEELFKKIVEINKQQGITILLIEQNARLALEISDYAYVLEHGMITLHDTADKVRSNPKVLEAYLGKFASHGAEML